MRRGAEELHVAIPLHQDIDLLGGIKTDAVVTGRIELCYILLPQLHDFLQKLLFHGNAIFVIFIEAPFEADRVLAENRTTIVLHNGSFSLFVSSTNSIMCFLLI